MSLQEDKYGRDIQLDEHMQPMVAANGEALITSGPQTVVQDIRVHLWTGRDGLFYDREYRAYVLDFVKDENTAVNRMALCAEVVRRINEDPRVVTGTAVCSVAAWDHAGVTLSAQFMIIEENHPFNLVIEVGNDKTQMVIKDVNTY
jgi:predicted PhzF superfamily epimerase YddE/YHI9